MGNSRVYRQSNAMCATILILSFYRVNGQISTPCTSSMISSFTPCLNFITGSSANGRSSPSAECCNSVNSLMTDSVDCACLVITGNVPLSLPLNRTLAISLPQACNGGLSLRCKSSGVPLPAPGPVLFGPTQAPTIHAPAHAPFSPIASKASSALAPAPVDDTTPEITPASPPEASPSLAPVAHPGIRPVLNPASSASTPSYNSVPSLFVMLLTMVVFQARLY